jgi:hypothetical protein
MYGTHYRYDGTKVSLLKCWRHGCKESVDPHDELGLCPEHIEEMRDPGYSVELAGLQLDSPEQREVPEGPYIQRPIE